MSFFTALNKLLKKPRVSWPRWRNFRGPLSEKQIESCIKQFAPAISKKVRRLPLNEARRLDVFNDGHEAFDFFAGFLFRRLELVDPEKMSGETLPEIKLAKYVFINLEFGRLNAMRKIRTARARPMKSLDQTRESKKGEFSLLDLIKAPDLRSRVDRSRVDVAYIEAALAERGLIKRERVLFLASLAGFSQTGIAEILGEGRNQSVSQERIRQFFLPIQRKLGLAKSFAKSFGIR